MGLVLECFDTEEELNQHVQQVATMISKKSPLTIRGIKKTVLFNRDHNVHDSLQQVKLWNTAFLQNNDLQEAFRAALSKSNPEYKED